MPCVRVGIVSKQALVGVSSNPGLLFVILNYLFQYRNWQPECIEINPDNNHTVPSFYDKKTQVLAHSTQFSLFDPNFDVHNWLKKCTSNLSGKSISFMSVHFGMNRFGDYRLWTFLPIQPSEKQILMAADRLKLISDHFGCHVGVENLALALSTEDVFRQIDSLEKLIKYSDCRILLDLHNLFCQSQNYSIDFDELVSRYPLEKVLEIHMSGGSDFRTTASHQEFRRDTHDGPLPHELIDVYKKNSLKLNNLQWIIYEVQPEFRLQSIFTAIKDINQMRTMVEEVPTVEYTSDSIKKLSYAQSLPLDLVELYNLLVKKNSDVVRLQQNYHLDPRAVEVCKILIEKWRRTPAV